VNVLYISTCKVIMLDCWHHEAAAKTTFFDSHSWNKFMFIYK